MRNAISALCVLLLLALVGACSDDEPGGGTGDVTDTSDDTPAPDQDGDAPDPDADAQPDSDTAPDAEPDLPIVGEPVTVQVGDVFPTGTAVRDGYQGDRGVVAEDGTVTLTLHPEGVLLVEEDAAPGPEADFHWDNATVYFVITDRFENGDPTNDASYGRQPDGEDEIGTWHGGDFRGLINRLDHLEDLGVNAVWITPPVEQVHGFVGGGSGDFAHWAYHGYWALDFTRLDANLGTEDDLRDLVTEAHARGIRVVFDVVLNHPGYATMADLGDVLPSVLSGDWEGWTPGEGENWHSWNDLFVNAGSEDWVDWWGPQWIRSRFPLHCLPGDDDLTKSLSFLPDFFTTVTEATVCAPARQPITQLPGVLRARDDTEAVLVEGNSVRDYLIDWHVRWVREFGIDGFRCDTAKHVELEAWAQLHDEATAALEAWRAENPGDPLDDQPFWMVAEVNPHGVTKDSYFTVAHFDSVLNFEFQSDVLTVRTDPDELDSLYDRYADRLNDDPTFNVLTYLSSHDTHLFFDRQDEDVEVQADAGTLLLLLPGGVQIFYGDETGRPAGPFGSDRPQHTRSDMNWDSIDEDLLLHWQRVGRFRERHRAVAAGSHTRLAFDGGYAFTREYSDDAIDDAVAVFLFEP